MRYVVDLHSHSGYAGGVGDISLPAVAKTMVRKGIHAFGTGDCLQPAWNESLRRQLREAEPGLYALDSGEPEFAGRRFILQTEIIITSPVPSGGRKGTHVVLAFPDFAATSEAIALLRKWGVKLDMGRPFVKCADAADVAEKCGAFRRIDEAVLVVPAHVLTPQGVYGSDHPVDGLADVFGEFAEGIRVVETGLSADPGLLALLPELDGRVLISNSDCHSPAINRVGREFTVVETASASYHDLVRAIRGGRIRYTAEFHPAEGRYFLTGHRAGLERHGSAYCYFSPDTAPEDGACPICGKPLTVGVLERALHLSKAQSAGGAGRKIGEVRPRQAAKRLVPLAEVVAAGLGMRSVSGKKTLALFDAILKKTGTESELWEMPAADIEHAFSGLLPGRVLEAVVMVRNGDFSFRPGFDGTYGELALGERVDWFGLSKVSR